MTAFSASESPITYGVRLNQLGYQPGASKRATVVHPACEPLRWQLCAADGALLLDGLTSVVGHDAASGDHVHIADFSAHRRPGTGYSLQVAGATSHPFAIDSAIYRRLKYNALAYFYHNRSGIAIEMPYAGGEQWTRPAGHIDVRPNRGDGAVTCFRGQDEQGRAWPGCDYQLDASGGWYDAGDHGKYVVNAGISVWTLLNLYERSEHLGAAGALAAFADGTLSIPENANGVPDLLDEVRWELEFLLRMQVPAGQALAGLVHHKVHDERWTGLPLAPHADQQQRWLYPPSTGATLNMAANAAQAARIWQRYDPAFAQRCLTAADSAWAAAQAHPALYAHDSFAGGGPYGDSDLSDEFYWAAAELFISTGKQEYRDFLAGSPHFAASLLLPGTLCSMTWGATAALGSISLAVVPNALAAAERAALRDRVVEAADAYVAALAGEGYGVPFTSARGYPWGSNSFVLNNMIMMALAYDLTSRPIYRQAVGESMDYLLGRNPMDQSYITGYGARPLQHPHHRFWADQLDPHYPAPPPGAVSGGPNSALQDPHARTLLAGRPAQKCFVDHIESWSTNEIAINWNAPLAWVVAFLDEQGASAAG